MNIHSLVPLIATVAYVPLFIILIANRPWKKQSSLFVLFLLCAMLWSFGDFLFRSDFLANEKLIIAKVVLCILTLGITQLHYFLRYFIDSKQSGFPLAYFLLIPAFIWIIFMVPQGVRFEDSVVPVYGWGIYPLALYFYVLLGEDVVKLVIKLKSLSDPIVYNQIFYLLVGLSIQLLFSTMAFTALGQEYPLAHIGNFLNALILTYSVLKHHLLDLRLVVRRGLTVLSTAAVGIGIYLILYVLGHFIFSIEVAPQNFMLGMVVALIVAFAVTQARGITSVQIDRLFFRDSYAYRKELDNFVLHKVKGVLSLDDLGNEFLSLLSGALNIKQALLLLPERDKNDFILRFWFPGSESRPHFFIKNDSPIIHWMKRENTYLTRAKLDISPEFKGLWSTELDSIDYLDIQLFFPVTSRDQLIGLLALGRKEDNKRYRLEDINLLMRIISMVATSVEKEYLQDQLRKRERDLALINRLSGVISSRLNIQEVYNSFVTELQDFTEVDLACIGLIEGSELYFSAIWTRVGFPWKTGQRVPVQGTATEWVGLNKKYYYEPDLAQSNRFILGDEFYKRGIRSIIYLPLANKGEVIGVLILGSCKSSTYGPDEISLLEHLSLQIAAPVENSQLYNRAEQIARIDSLTELFNRRHFDERLREEIGRHTRYGDMMSIFMLNLDNFKKYNDTYGHLLGDKLIIVVAQIIKNSIRASDLAFRYGGDDFAVLLPNSTSVDAFSVAERIREKVCQEMISRQLDITMSIGLASWPGDGVTLDELCNAADTALYYAKRTGKNRTSIASKTLFSLSEPSVSVHAEAEVLNTIYALAATLEARDKYTYGHSRRVSRFSVSVAEALNLLPEQVAAISAAALLHDIGKIGIPDNVLNKSGQLLADEWDLLKSHPRLSATIIGHVPSLHACLAAVKHHHERWDGSGYPTGLEGEAIPIEARILAVTDAFEAMISNRPYRGPLSYKNAIAQLETCSGTQFDPKVVKAFIPIALASAPDDVELKMHRILPGDSSA